LECLKVRCSVLYPRQGGGIEVEILPPASKEIKDAVRRILDKHEDAFEEMKRLGWCAIHNLLCPSMRM
jgi:hypothetical protein